MVYDYRIWFISVILVVYSPTLIWYRTSDPASVKNFILLIAKCLYGGKRNTPLSTLAYVPLVELTSATNHPVSSSFKGLPYTSTQCLLLIYLFLIDKFGMFLNFSLVFVLYRPNRYIAECPIEHEFDVTGPVPIRRLWLGGALTIKSWSVNLCNRFMSDWRSPLGWSREVVLYWVSIRASDVQCSNDDAWEWNELNGIVKKMVTRSKNWTLEKKNIWEN